MKKKLLGIFAKLALLLFGAFVATFTIYMFNLEIRPFLNKHYDSQKRDRRIV